MENRNREFKGIWIPRIVYESQDVCWTAKVLFIEIDSFTQQGKDCFFSNDYLAKFLGVSATQVSKHISKLIEIGWIEQTGFDGRKRFLKSLISTDFKAALKSSSRQNETTDQGSNEVEFKHTNTVTKTDTNLLVADAPKENSSSKIIKGKTQSELREWLKFKVAEYKEKYPSEMLREFYGFYTELDTSGTQMRIEDKKRYKYFDVGKRLATWFKNNERKYQSKNNTVSEQPTISSPFKKRTIHA